MATFVEITPDPFATSFASVLANQQGNALEAANSGLSNVYGEFDHVRRPVRGIQLKRDTYATIEVRTADGNNIPLTDAGGLLLDDQGKDAALTNRYSNFLAQSIQESREERSQVVLTFGEPYIFFYREQPRIIQVSGVLMNTEDFNWRAEWWYNYDNYLRGTRCVENHSRVYLSWDDVIVGGYLMNCNAQESSDNRNIVMFSFSMFLTDYANISNLFSTDFPGSKNEFILGPGLDTTGEGIGNLESTTMKVRQLNIEASKAGLLDMIRTGIAEVVNLTKSFGDIFQAVEQFLGGTLVRMPAGFSGSYAYDSGDLQFSQASMGNTTETIIAEEKYTIKVNAGRQRWEPAKYGAIKLNVDEYLARNPTGKPATIKPKNIFEEQMFDERMAETKVREVFLNYGIIAIDPPREVLLLVNIGGFGTLSIGF
jgi:hypothetical protein